MKITDILRSLADKLDTIDNRGSQEQSAEPHDFVQPEQDAEDPGTMIPPLQQKLELLKKAVDVPNIFDQDEHEFPNELDAIKKNAGFKTAVIHLASDNEPMD